MRSIFTIILKFGYMIAVLMTPSEHAVSQPDPPIQNEYRFTQFVIKPINGIEELEAILTHAVACSGCRDKLTHAEET